ncbi:MAG: hypothetical protein KDI30_06010, partial [Pseudomonadales bacterium]|nr:hypothetical protein [Pseudomonadales bacterium]
VIGSNIFNILLVIATPAIIAPMRLDPLVFSRDYLAMLFLTLALAVLLLTKYLWGIKNNRPAKLGLTAGLLMAFYYIAYIIALMP